MQSNFTINKLWTILSSGLWWNFWALRADFCPFETFSLCHLIISNSLYIHFQRRRRWRSGCRRRSSRRFPRFTLSASFSCCFSAQVWKLARLCTLIERTCLLRRSSLPARSFLLCSGLVRNLAWFIIRCFLIHLRVFFQFLFCLHSPFLFQAQSSRLGVLRRFLLLAFLFSVSPKLPGIEFQHVIQVVIWILFGTTRTSGQRSLKCWRELPWL